MCEYSHTIDYNGKSTPASGSKLVTIKDLGNAEALVKIQDSKAEFAGAIYDDEINVDTTYTFKGIKAIRSFSVNRYTGQFTYKVEIGGIHKGLVHHGKCKLLEKLF